MKNNSNFIFCSGLGSTGSSAFINLLQEYEEINVFDREFRLLVDPNGILDLRRDLFDNWSYFKSDMALRRFKNLYSNLSNRGLGPYALLRHSSVFKDFDEKCNNYFNELIFEEYDGIWYGIDTLLSRVIIKLGFKKRGYLNSRKMYIPNEIDKQQFDLITRSFLNNLFLNKKNSFKRTVIEENLLGFFATEISEILPGSKIINVIRNPLDVISDSIRVNWHACPQNISKYIKFQKLAYSRLIEKENTYRKSKIYGKSILTLKFEDLVLKTEKTRFEIENFLEISKLGKSANKFFNPNISKKNIHIYKRFLSDEHISVIKKEFDFFLSHYNYQ